VEVDDKRASMDWTELRFADLQTYGMRNSKLRRNRSDGDDFEHHRRVGVYRAGRSRNLYVKSNLSGEFTVVNDYLVRDLKERGLWDEVMVLRPEILSTARCRASTGFRPILRADSTQTAFELDANVGGGSCIAPSEVDRPGANRAEYLYGGARRAEAGRGVQAGVASRFEDHVLPSVRWAATHVEKSTVAHGQLNSVPSG